MHKKLKLLQCIAGLLGTLIFVTSVVLFVQLIPPTSHDISEGPVRGLGSQDSVISSYTTHDPITITSNEDFTAQGFLGNGIEADPYIFESYNITTTGNCIFIQDTDAYFVIRECVLTGGTSGGGITLEDVINGEIRNNTISGSDYGVYLLFSANNIVVNNTISGNYNGVYILGSSNTTLSSNIFVNNGIRISGFGLEVWQHTITPDNLVNGKPLGYFWSWTSGTIDGTQYGQVILANCTGVTVKNGVFSNATMGIVMGHSSYCSLMNNTLSGNDCGVYLYFSLNNTVVNNTISGNYWSGVMLHTFSNNIVVNNTISGNDYGMFIYFSSTNTVTNNNISGNGRGVYLSSSSNYNLIYLNVIADNKNVNANDYGTDNHWNTTVMGNYWSDHNGIGVYNVPGSAGSIDYFPFIYPPETTTPTIDQPADLAYEARITGNTITWSPNDDHPSHYGIYQNSTLVVSYSWDGSSITVVVDGLSVGVYSYTIVVYDTSGNWVSDTVIVTVVDTTPPIINQPLDIEYEEGTTSNTITWAPSDDNPSHYMIYRNGTEVVSASWDGNSITVNIDGLSVGVYNYTNVVYDTSGNYVRDTVLVIVLPQVTTTITTTTTTTTTTNTTTNTATTSGEVSGLAIALIGVFGIEVVVAVIILMRRHRGSTTGLETYYMSGHQAMTS